jgi:stearoyl-CoA desaturase (delta-9 desaturase)
VKQKFASPPQTVHSNPTRAVPESPAKQAPDFQKPTIAIKITMLAVVIMPFVGLLASIVFLWGWGLTWFELTILGVMYLLTALGITVGYHRYFTHRSFDTNPVVEFILAVLGSMAVQGPLLFWVAQHRLHHQHSDHDNDPHSPHLHGTGFLGLVRGFWHAHLGWTFRDYSKSHLSRYVRDLYKVPLLRVVSNLFPLWVIVGLLIPTALGFVFVGGWRGPVLGLIWGGLVRIFLVHHVTWSVNSICHLWGQRPYPDRDQSRNNFLFGIFALGEGWHNNHHAFPTSAQHGLRWWQIDVSYWVIRGLVLTGLAWNVKKPQLGLDKASL